MLEVSVFWNKTRVAIVRPEKKEQTVKLNKIELNTTVGKHFRVIIVILASEVTSQLYECTSWPIGL